MPNETTALEVLDPIKRQVDDLPSIFKLAEQIVPTGFLPEHIKTPGQAVAIILAGRELGIGPMLALRSIWMLRGKIELSADLQLSLFKRDGGQSKFLTLNEQEAKLWFKHPNGDEHTESFTMQDAARAGLTDYNWKKWPKAMLRSRVITAGLKSVGFEPTCGAYGNGEIGGPQTPPPHELEPSLTVTAPETPPAPSPTIETPTEPKNAPTVKPDAKAPTSTPKLTPDEIRDKTLVALKAKEGMPSRQVVAAFLVEAICCDNPDKWPEKWLPSTPKELRALGVAIADFEAEGRAEIPYKAKNLAGPALSPDTRRTEAIPPPANASGWTKVVIHTGALRGSALGLIPEEVLQDLWRNWKPEPVGGKLLKTDLALQQALGEAAAERGWQS